MLRTAAVSLALIVLTCGVFAQTRHFEFVNYDDKGYVTGQPELHRGFSTAGVRWALTSTFGGYMPLTGLSLLADAGLHGIDAGAFHRTNVIFHALTVALLFLFLKRATGALWTSALVAVLFAIHPLRVESVAWVSSRKDLVCGLFWMLTLHAYAFYVGRPNFARYALVFLGVCAAMLAKPMAVTLPCVLLLTDLWPLYRPAASWRNRILEKLPLFIPVIAASVATFLIQRDSGAVSASDTVPVGLRVANATVAYFLYLWKTIWPVDLIPLYPFPIDGIPAWQILAASLMLLTVSFVTVRLLSAAPWVAVGWFWYLGTLVPVIGLVQVGAQRMADRYMYLPQIGLFIVVAWSLRAMAQRRVLVPFAALASAAALVACTIVTYRQTAHWRDSLTLWSHTVAITPESVIARSSLGEAYMTRKAWNDARRELLYAIRLNPTHRPALLNLARVETRIGRLDYAILRCRVLVGQRPDDPDAHTAWAAALIRLHDYNEAIAHLDIALHTNPNHPEALSNLGAALVLMERPAEAIAPLEAVLVRQPRDVVVLTNLGGAYYLLEDFAKARQYCDEALHIEPAYEQALVLKRILDTRTP